MSEKPIRYSDEVVTEIKILRCQGVSYKKIAKRLNCRDIVIKSWVEPSFLRRCQDIEQWPEEDSPYEDHVNFALLWDFIPLEKKKFLLEKSDKCNKCTFSTDKRLKMIGMGPVVCTCNEVKVKKTIKPQPIQWFSEEEIETNEEDGEDEKETEEKYRSVDTGRHWHWHNKYRQYWVS